MKRNKQHKDIVEYITNYFDGYDGIIDNFKFHTLLKVYDEYSNELRINIYDVAPLYFNDDIDIRTNNKDFKKYFLHIMKTNHTKFYTSITRKTNIKQLLNGND